MSILVEGDKIILQKHQDVCAICGSPDDIAQVKGRPICADCVRTVKSTK